MGPGHCPRGQGLPRTQHGPGQHLSSGPRPLWAVLPSQPVILSKICQICSPKGDPSEHLRDRCQELPARVLAALSPGRGWASGSSVPTFQGPWSTMQTWCGLGYLNHRVTNCDGHKRQRGLPASPSMSDCRTSLQAKGCPRLRGMLGRGDTGLAPSRPRAALPQGRPVLFRGNGAGHKWSWAQLWLGQ